MKEEETRNETRGNLKKSFVSRFQEMVSAPIDPSSIREMGESITLVWRTNWVAISLVRRLTFPISLSILAEISVPVLAVNNDSTKHTALPDDVILHMEYLQTLLDAGFDLQVIGEECLWVASRDFNEIPPLEILDTLMPPGSNVQSS